MPANELIVRAQVDLAISVGGTAFVQPIIRRSCGPRAVHPKDHPGFCTCPWAYEKARRKWVEELALWRSCHHITMKVVFPRPDNPPRTLPLAVYQKGET